MSRFFRIFKQATASGFLNLRLREWLDGEAALGGDARSGLFAVPDFPNGGIGAGCGLMPGLVQSFAEWPAPETWIPSCGCGCLFRLE